MKKVLAFFVLISAVSFCSCALPLSSSASASSTSGAGGGKNQTTTVYNTINNQASPSNTQQQAPVNQQPQYQQQPATRGGAVRNFAIKSYNRIVEDNRNGDGEHLRSLILLMESEGVERDEALPLIKRALRKSNGNAEAFGNELENSL